MQAIEILAEEHRDIASALACLKQLIRTTVRSDSLDGESAAEILEYLEHFVDGIHQDKEEQVVFPRLLERSTVDARPRVEQLLREHQSERRELERLRAQLEGAAYGDALSRDGFVNSAVEYARKLREHAHWEDEHLLPLAEESLGEWEDAPMLADYRAIEERYFAGSRRDPREMLERIQARYGLGQARRPSLVLAV